MIVQSYKGRGRKAGAEQPRKRRGWIYRLFMAWFSKSRGARF